MKLYKRYEALSPIYQGGLTNHLPMVLTALKNLGLSYAEIVVRLDDYRDSKGILDLTESTTPVSEYEQAYVNRTSFYLGEINHKGYDVVIGEFLSKHKMNLGCALFHGLIRLAYAKQERNDLMIAQSLSYYELSSEEVEFHSTFKGEEEFLENFYQMKKMLKESDFEFQNTRTSDKFMELFDLDFVKDNLHRLRVPKKEMILDLILSEYEKTQCFYNLHLITGFEALFELEEYIYDFSDVLNQFLLYAQLFLLFTTKEIEKSSEEEPVEDRSFSELIEEVPNLTDAHDIKLFYSLLKLNKLFYNERLLSIANTIFKE